MRDARSDRRQRERGRGSRGGTIASFPAQHQWASPGRARLDDAPELFHNIPAPLTSFVGRGREIAVVAELLIEIRLLTLTGAGGVGKTRLALEVAAELVEAYPDGVWLAELAELADPALVPRAVASALGISEQPDRALPVTLADALAPRSLLLVLDNCEHLAAACAELAEALLRACPDLRILATSRHALNAVGETTWLVPSLSLPDGARTTTEEGRTEMPSSFVLGPSSAIESEAVRLFVERARAARTDFALTDEDAPIVAEICARLDGIPLALELAAARVRVLTPAQIRARLDDRFRLLDGGRSTGLPLQQTLRGTMDWSYQLLSDAERVLLRRLSVFAGGWTLEAAELVTGVGCRASGDEGEGSPSPDTRDPTPDTLDVLAGLVDKSLVLVGEQGGQARYRLLQTVREYAAEKLREAGEEAGLRARHADWFLALAERAAPELSGPEQATWLARLEVEHENLRIALAWLAERGEADHGLRFGGALWRFWFARNYPAEGRMWLARLLALDGASGRTPARALVLFAAARLAIEQADFASATALAGEALALAGEVGDRQTMASSLTVLGHAARGRGDLDAARSHYEAGLALRRELGNWRDIAISLTSLGHVTLLQGDYAAARACYEESLTLHREVGNAREIANALHRLGEIAHEAGRYDEARRKYEESLAVVREVGDRQRIAYILEGFASLAAVRGRAERALRLAGAAAALRRAIGVPLPPVEVPGLERRLERARRAPGADAAAWTAGSAMSVDEAIEYALAGSEFRAPSSEWSGPRLGTRNPELGTAAQPLTRRERDIVPLVARGLTNRRIAAELVISELTVQTHLRNILRKLGLATRAQLAGWAVEQGLR